MCSLNDLLQFPQVAIFLKKSRDNWNLQLSDYPVNVNRTLSEKKRLVKRTNYAKTICGLFNDGAGQSKKSGKRQTAIMAE